MIPNVLQMDLTESKNTTHITCPAPFNPKEKLEKEGNGTPPERTRGEKTHKKKEAPARRGWNACPPLVRKLRAAQPSGKGVDERKGCPMGEAKMTENLAIVLPQPQYSSVGAEG